MAKHRITLVRDDSTQHGYYSNEEWIEERRSGVVVGFSIERTEKLPDPPIVKKFEVEIEFPAATPAVPGMNYSDGIKQLLTGETTVRLVGGGRTVKVREV